MFAEETPYTCLTSPHCREIKRTECVCKTEVAAVTLIQAALFCVLHNIFCIEAVLRVIFREGGYSGTVCVCRDITVGNTDCHPYGSLVQVLAVLIFWFAGNYVHKPYLVLVGK